MGDPSTTVPREILSPDELALFLVGISDLEIQPTIRNPFMAMRVYIVYMIIVVHLFLTVVKYPKPRLYIFLFNVAFFITYSGYYHFGAKTQGGYAWGMIRTKLFHIHHWLWTSILFVGTYATGFRNSLLDGFILASIIHGVQFGDWHKIVL